MMSDRIDESKTAVAAAGLRPLTDLTAVDELLSESSQRPIILFKHSPTCGISAHVYEDLMPLVRDPEQAVDWYLISVVAHRDISQEIATRLKVRHASPQVIVLRHGGVIWHGSHFSISARAVSRALTLR